jgi:hypothetical protein
VLMIEIRIIFNIPFLCFSRKHSDAALLYFYQMTSK